MLKRPTDWDEIPVNEMSEKLKLGGRMCVIKNVKLFTHDGTEKVSLELDIAEEENKDFYQKKYDARNENSKFWDDGATLVFLSDPKEDKDKSYMKGLLTAIETYNDGYQWNWDEQSLKGKKVGVNFSLKEYQGNDGKIYTKPQAYRWVNKKENFRPDFIPNVRLADNSYIDYAEYEAYINSKKVDTTKSKNEQIDKFIENNNLLD